MWYKNNWQAKLSPLLQTIEVNQSLPETHRLIVETSVRHNDKITHLLNKIDGKFHHELKLIPSLVLEISSLALEELARSRYVKKIWVDLPVSANLDVAAPTIGSSAAQKIGFTGKGISVAVIDTGIHPHPDFTIPQNRILAWQDFINQKNEPYDDNGHGTHVSGIIAGNGSLSNGRYCGIAPEANLIGVKTLDSNGSGFISRIISGIEWCIEHTAAYHLKVLNLSLGAPAQASFKIDPICRATTKAWQHGLVVAVAAGNDGPLPNTINSPGINPVIITVGNYDDHETITPQDDQLSNSSSRGPTNDHLNKPDLIAPGTKITSTWISNDYHSLTGTSMATPMVAGAVAQLLQKYPKYSPNQIKKILITNTKPLGIDQNLEGAGALNLEGLFKTNPNQGFFKRLITELKY